MRNGSTSDGAAPAPALEGAATFVEVLRARAAAHPDRTAFTYLVDGEDEPVTLTYGALDARARAIAATLGEACAPDDRALMLYPPGLDFVAAFFGCLYAGVVPAPAYPPDPARLHRSLPRLQSLAADAGARVVLASSALAPLSVGALGGTPALRGLRWLFTDTAPRDGAAARWAPPAPGAGRIALLQYTSGSTGTPRGVMLTHANLLHQVRTVLAMYRERTVWRTAVSWLPQFHDAGLIGLTLLPLYAGVHTVLLSPIAFLQRPFRWLQAVARHRAEISGGPNFAYDLCVRKVTPAERDTLDLSAWAAACNGAEPVHADTLERFARFFAPCGFRARAFYPCWGLAEATLLLSAGTEGREPRTRTVARGPLATGRVAAAAPAAAERRLVACGRPIRGHRLLVVDPETRSALPPGQVGELWAAGPCVAQGYWNRPEETRAVFGATLRDGDGPFLRTGDLGFIADGEVFLAGRLKDLIICRGRNHHPEDVERTIAQCHPALRPSCGAAFALEREGGEGVVVVHEVRAGGDADLDAVVRAIRRAVADTHGLDVHAVTLIGPGTIPKTSSGKLQRHACREAFVAGTLAPLAAWRSAPPAAPAARAEERAPSP